MLYALELKSKFNYGRLPNYIGDIFPYIFSNQGSAICGIFHNENQAENHKIELEEAYSNTYISIFKENSYEKQIVCFIDNIELNILKIPFNTENILDGEEIYFILKNNDIICEYNKYDTKLCIQDFISLSQNYVETDEKNCLFQVYKIRINDYYPLTNQAMEPLHEFNYRDKY